MQPRLITTAAILSRNIAFANITARNATLPTMITRQSDDNSVIHWIYNQYSTPYNYYPATYNYMTNRGNSSPRNILQVIMRGRINGSL